MKYFLTKYFSTPRMLRQQEPSSTTQWSNWSFQNHLIILCSPNMSHQDHHMLGMNYRLFILDLIAFLLIIFIEVTKAFLSTVDQNHFLQNLFIFKLQCSSNFTKINSLSSQKLPILMPNLKLPQEVSDCYCISCEH